jgi:hypothetical protein
MHTNQQDLPPKNLNIDPITAENLGNILNSADLG